jgi:hypothetical protein
VRDESIAGMVDPNSPLHIAERFIAWIFNPEASLWLIPISIGAGLTVALAPQLRNIRLAHLFFAVAWIWSLGSVFEEVTIVNTSLKSAILLVFITTVLIGVLALISFKWVESNYHESKSHPAAAVPLQEPVIHIEPESEIVFSTRSDLGQTKGVYTITLHNTGIEDIEVSELSQKYFLAQRSETIIIKRVDEIANRRPMLVASKGQLSIHLDFNPYLETFKEVAANFAGPSRAGVYIVVKCRRFADGKNYTFTRSYGLFNFDGVAIFTEGTAMDTTPLQLRHQFVTLHEIIPFLDSAEHWTSLTKEVRFDADGKVHTKLH